MTRSRPLRSPWRPIALAAVAAALLLAPAAAADPGPARPAETAARCAKPTEQQDGTSDKYELTDQGRERSYILHLPDGYSGRDDWPLIIAFHGRGGTGTELEGYSGLSTVPAVVAYPNGELGTGDGYRRAWQGAPYAPPEVDDVAFTSALLDRLQADWCVDPDRSYATGKSNGGGLAGLLGCRLPDRFAAVAVVAGAFYPASTEDCAGAGPMPIMIIHGTGDATIPYDGDADRGLPAIPDLVDAWVDRNGCRSGPETRSVGTDVTISRWDRCSGGVGVSHVAVTGGGHVWPDAHAYSGGGYLTRTVAAEDLAWQFFRGYSPAATAGAVR
ncbi:alpha/beta hydrolase family esterase [Microlunatus sp. GCM10028923]|uniref:alpha/beta hydrolase family esterase n=1 Tax=Microlunatus sp. GCM10028923 TaxID=3273400 RepID=UPI00361DE567